MKIFQAFLKKFLIVSSVCLFCTTSCAVSYDTYGRRAHQDQLEYEREGEREAARNRKELPPGGEMPAPIHLWTPHGPKVLYWCVEEVLCWY